MDSQRHKIIERYLDGQNEKKRDITYRYIKRWRDAQINKKTDRQRAG